MDSSTWVKRLQLASGATAVMALGFAIVALFLIAVVGVFAVDGGKPSDETVVAGQTGDVEGGTTGETVPGETTTTIGDSGVTGATIPGGAPAPKAGTAATAPKAGVPGATTQGTLPSAPGATRIGVSASDIKWGLHAPKTFDGAPLNLAEDPLFGVDLYLKVLNDKGGINGRKITQVFADDRYTVEGGEAAGRALINDSKVFFVSGTLGVDQIAQVAKLARAQGVPYMAAGGSEAPFKDIGMFQTGASYDTHLIKLAQYLGKEKSRQGSPYFGRTKVGVSRLDSPFIEPSVEVVFKDELQKNGLQLVKVVTVDKPTVQKTYAFQIQELIASGADIVVPAQDPITTSRMVAECKAQSCNSRWKWTSSNFAHESDVALTLTQGEWTGIRALAGGCYYLSTSANCGALKTARDEWIKAAGQDSFNKDGQGGVAGYQVVHWWVKAIKDMGADPTREKMKAILANYENYNDLVSGPITHKGSRNFAHGAELMVIYEATNTPGPSNSGNTWTWKQISDGFVSQF